MYTPLWVGDSLYVQWTGDVIASVTATFSRAAPAVVDAELAYADGRVDEVTGTPNHPFWVAAVRDYVPLGELEVGTVLHVQGGGEAILVSKTWRQGDFEVFDFEVEGLQGCTTSMCGARGRMRPVCWSTTRPRRSRERDRIARLEATTSSRRQASEGTLPTT